MQNLLKMIPTLIEYRGMDNDAKSLLGVSLYTAHIWHDLPEKVSEYHPVEIVAYMASKNGYILDLIEEFDLGVDYEN